MIIALDAGSDIGKRAARIFLGDPRLRTLVMINPSWVPKDTRVIQKREFDNVDVVVSDGTTPLNSLIGRASVSGSPLVVWSDVDISHFGAATVPVVVGANVGSTLADALTTHPSSLPTEYDTVKVAWTEPGTPLQKGTPIAFPDPVGMMWSRVANTTEQTGDRFVAFRDDEWAGATAVIDGPTGQRTVGVADLGSHLEAVTLAAVTFVAATGAFDPGIQSTAASREAILNEALNLEMDVAVWRSP